MGTELALSDTVEREIQHLRREFNAALNAHAQLSAERDAARGEALRVAQVANDSRLNEMNGFRGALSDQSALMITRVEVETARAVIAEKTEEAIATLAAKLDAEIRPLHASIEMISRPNWTLVTSAMSIALVLVGGTYTIVGLKIENAIQPNATAIVTLIEHNRQSDATILAISARTGDSAQADIVSRGDRAQLNTRVAQAEQIAASGQAERRTSEGNMREKLAEVESQVKALSMRVNLEKDATQQLLSLIWPRVFRADLPPTHYRPTTLFREN